MIARVYADAFLEHFRNPRGQGGLDAPTHQGAATDAACGDELELDLRVEGGRIAEARFRVRGCSGAIAAGSALVTLLPGRAARPDTVTRAEIEATLGGIPANKRHVLRLAERVLADAFG
jgi:NifU-like protein involved in Fe-S cluster formation